MTQPHVPQILALTGIRILAAAWVVIEHFRNVLYGLFPEAKGAHVFIESGYLGVEVFFVLSGFIISHNYAERFRHFTSQNYQRFLLNRFARLYPVHIVTLAVVALLVISAAALHINLASDGKYDLVGFLMNVLMLQALPPAEAWNGPAWSISAELGAYVLFPLLALAVMRIRSRVALLAITGTALAVTIGGQFALASTSGFAPTGYGSIWLRIFGEFAAGCFMWRFWSLGVKPGRRYDFYAMAAALGIVTIVALSGEIGAVTFLALPFIALFVLASASAAGPVGKFLSSRFMDYGGRISYSLYMVHFLVLMIGRKLFAWQSFEGAPLVVRLGVLVAYFALSLLAAALLYRFVEEPGRRAIARLGARLPGVDQRPQPSMTSNS